MKTKLEENLASASTSMQESTGQTVGKHAISSILSLCLIVGMTTAAFSQPIKSKLAPVSADRVLTSKNGTSTKFRLIEREGESIVANRSSDGKRFIITLDSLSDADRVFINTWAPEIEKPQPLETINTPEKVFLALPFDKQDHGGICVAAALLNVMQYVDPKIEMSQREMFSLLNDGRSGANYPQIQAALLTLGYESKQLKLGEDADDRIIRSLKNSLSKNIPALVANSGHMITVLGFDSTNPDKKTITVWDQRDPEKNATDLESIGVVNMSETQFVKQFRTVVLIKPSFNPEMGMDRESAKISRKLTIQTGREMTTYKFTPPTNEPDLLNYIEHAMTARIAVELRKGARVFIKATDESLLEITQTPNQKQKEKDKM